MRLLMLLIVLGLVLPGSVAPATAQTPTVTQIAASWQWPGGESLTNPGVQVR